MLDHVQEKLSHPSGAQQQKSEPDGRNAGVGKTENLCAFGAAIAATFVARNALQAGWRATLNREPPKNPASREVDWNDALLWGLASGALVGIVRIAARRASSDAYHRYVHRDR
ncbi:hypothetical protein K227x_30950 [Rubripirellula lacrimiformis]|uniref:DUF4235 domain-containing protein n=1 Tax=Rubripirellula lacrimiformis TaxID=1930273 RepID=A0A517NC74_9BACT|nr:DUF4235 domain-containing protein [Rubripirellula lacrimiformis]QDT04701.1 hypothetical protein K227x_30950 [Rubripirellula lacrimiformis]